MKRSPLRRRTPLRAKKRMLHPPATPTPAAIKKRMAAKKLARSTLKRTGRLRPRSLKNRKQPRNFPYMRWIKTLPCAACGRMGSEAAHTGPRGLGQKSSDESCIPLCADHHRTGRDAIHVLGPRRFEDIHGFVVVDLVRRLNEVWAVVEAHVPNSAINVSLAKTNEISYV